MLDLLKQLYTDHQQLQRLLYCLQKQVSFYESGQPDKAELSFILKALDYIQEYPESWHHPVEQIIFTILLAKKIPVNTVSIIKKLCVEHQELEKKSHQLKMMFIHFAVDPDLKLGNLIDIHRDFIAAQSRHIEIENRHILPIIKDYLTSDDWENVHKQMQQPKDPLFGFEKRKNYQLVYQEIIKNEPNSATTNMNTNSLNNDK